MAHYGTIAEADLFFTQEYLDKDQLWAQEPVDNKTAALSMATRAIEGLNFAGSKNSESQELEFPRGDDTQVPDDVKHATYILALEILDGADVNFMTNKLSENAMIHGGARNRRTTEFIPAHLRNGIPSADSWNLLKPYLRDPGAITLSRVD